MIENNRILTVNAGSSSIKIVIIEYNLASKTFTNSLDISASTNLQSENSILIKAKDEDPKKVAINATSTEEIIQSILEQITSYFHNNISYIGHRIVFGGNEFYETQKINDTFVSKLKELSNYDPEHIPLSVNLIDSLAKYFPAIDQYACFDSAFFHKLPRLAQIIPIPKKYQSSNLRKYGYHGLSYEYILSELQIKGDQAEVNGKLILAHLGNGVSLAAFNNAKPIDTTMSFTPASGVVMSTRTGDIDPGVLTFLNSNYSVDFKELNHLINQESGLLAVSELSSDMYTLLQNEATNIKAAEAVNLFCYQIKKAIGSLTAVLGGVDTIVFSGGIGEASSIIRARILSNFDYMGIKVDESLNNQNADVISANDSKIKIRVIPTNEALIIAKQIVNISR